MHRTAVLPGFTKYYGVKKLVWFEQHESRESAFTRERQIKKWNRAWKRELIEKTNPGWPDLYEEIAQGKNRTPSFREGELRLTGFAAILASTTLYSAFVP